MGAAAGLLPWFSGARREREGWEWAYYAISVYGSLIMQFDSFGKMQQASSSVRLQSVSVSDYYFLSIGLCQKESRAISSATEGPATFINLSKMPESVE